VHSQGSDSAVYFSHLSQNFLELKDFLVIYGGWCFGRGGGEGGSWFSHVPVGSLCWDSLDVYCGA
jgi:hypothetical protein